MRTALALIALLTLGACATGTVGDSLYQRELAALEKSCHDRGGVLSSTGANTGIRAPSSPASSAARPPASIAEAVTIRTAQGVAAPRPGAATSCLLHCSIAWAGDTTDPASTGWLARAPIPREIERTRTSRA